MATEVQYKAELINGKPVLYCRTNSEGSWENITHTRYQLDQLELYNYHLNITKCSQCRIELSEFTFKVFINFICYHIKMCDKLLWSYCISPITDPPLELLFKTNKISLNFNEGTLDLDMRGYVNNWVEPGRPLQKFRTGRIKMVQELFNW